MIQTYDNPDFQFILLGASDDGKGFRKLRTFSSINIAIKAIDIAGNAPIVQGAKGEEELHLIREPRSGRTGPDDTPITVLEIIRENYVEYGWKIVSRIVREVE